MSVMEVDVLCVGHAVFDITMQVDHHPGPDEKCFASGMIACGGGPAANAAVTVARLGGSAAFAGYLGNDLYGARCFEEFKDEGVDTVLVVRSENPTPIAFILVKPDGSRTVVNYKQSTPALAEGAVDFSRCSPRVILFDGHEPSISVPLAHSAKAAGIPTVMDAGSVHEGTIALAPLVDYVVASARFARDFTSEPDPKTAFGILAARFPRVVVTLGEDGLIWRTADGEGSMPAFKVNAVDTTGAGDVFHGAFALGLARGMAFEEILTYASAAGALACTKAGARTAIPTEEEVREFVGERAAGITRGRVE